jgi:hypothetical protein
MVLLQLLGIILAGFASFGIVYVLEKRLRRPGLAFLVVALAMLTAATLGFLRGNRLLPALFLLQGIGFLYSANWRRTVALTAPQSVAPTS